MTTTSAAKRWIYLPQERVLAPKVRLLVLSYLWIRFCLRLKHAEEMVETVGLGDAEVTHG